VKLLVGPGQPGSRPDDACATDAGEPLVPVHGRLFVGLGSPGLRRSTTAVVAEVDLTVVDLLVMLADYAAGDVVYGAQVLIDLAAPWPVGAVVRHTGDVFTSPDRPGVEVRLS
jgi:hypothetical protein